jgi:hypothetical protein
MAVIEGTRQKKTWQGFYDFAVDAGVVGTITLRSNDGPIPNGAIITDGYLEVETALSGGTSTGALQAEAANDTVNQAATTGAPWSTTGRKSIIPVATGATALKTTAARSPGFVIGTANLTQGKFNLVLVYR